MIQTDSYTPTDTSDLDDRVFDDDTLIIDIDDTSTMFDKELYNTVNLDDSLIISFKLTLEIYTKNQSSKVQFFNKYFELFDLPDTGTIHDSMKSLNDKSFSSPDFKQSQAPNRITRTKNELRLQQRKD